MLCRNTVFLDGVNTNPVVQNLFRTKIISVLLKNLFSALSLKQRFDAYDDLRVIFQA